MQTHHLESFILAADLGSLSKAASATYITVPSFSQQISTLERELGFPLFVRSTKGVELSEAGRSFYPCAKRVIRMLEQARQEGLSISRRERLLRICYAPEEMPPFLSELIMEFNKDHPNVTCEFVSIPYQNQIEEVQSEKADICFYPCLTSFEDGLEFVPLYKEAYSCCMSPDDPLLNLAVVTLDDLFGTTLYIDQSYHEELQTRRLIRHIQDNKLPITIDGRIFDLSLPIHIALHGGALILPESYCSTVCPPLKPVPLDWEPVVYGLVHRKNPSVAVQSFFDAAHKILYPG